MDGKERISVEAGHVYFGEAPFKRAQIGQNLGIGAEQPTQSDIVKGLDIGIKLSSLLEEHGFDVSRVLLQDDMSHALHTDGRVLHGHASGLYEVALNLPVSQTEEYGFTPLNVIKESELRPAAEEVISELNTALAESNKHRISSSGVLWFKIDGKDRSIRLRGYGDDPDSPSCEVLDYCAYKQRLDSGLAITVLPSKYKTQQERVRALFRIQNEFPPVAVIYYDSEGNVEEVSYWNEEIEGTIRSSIEKVHE